MNLNVLLNHIPVENSSIYGKEIGQQELGDLVGVRKSTVSNDESLFKKAGHLSHLWVDELKQQLKPEYEQMTPAIFKDTVESAYEKLKAGDGKVRKHSKKKAHKHKHSRKPSPVQEDSNSSNSSTSSSEGESDIDRHKRRKHK